MTRWEVSQIKVQENNYMQREMFAGRPESGKATGTQEGIKINPA